MSALCLLRCDISAVDYAAGDVKIIRRQPTTVGGKPAIELLLKNTGQKDAQNVVITIKAKLGQRDVDTATLSLEKIQVNETVPGTGIFSRIKSHDEYDFLTFAVSFSS